MFTKLLIKLGLKEDPKVVLERLFAEIDSEESVKVIPAKKKAAKKPVKKAPVKKKAAKKKAK